LKKYTADALRRAEPGRRVTPLEAARRGVGDELDVSVSSATSIWQQ
jgi:hypothetical protein